MTRMPYDYKGTRFYLERVKRGAQIGIFVIDEGGMPVDSAPVGSAPISGRLQRAHRRERGRGRGYVYPLSELLEAPRIIDALHRKMDVYLNSPLRSL